MSQKKDPEQSEEGTLEIEKEECRTLDFNEVSKNGVRIDDTLEKNPSFTSEDTKRSFEERAL